MRQYSCKQHNRQHFSNVTLQLLVTELEELNQLANKHGVTRHAILSSAFHKGLPAVIANLETRQAGATLNNGQG